MSEARAAAARANEKHFEGTPCRVCKGTKRYTCGNTCVACALKHSKSGQTKYRERAARSAPGGKYNGPPCKHCGGSERYMRSRSCVVCTTKRNNAAEKQKRSSPEFQKKQRDRWLLRRYGVTGDYFDTLLAAQGGVCAVCGTDKPGGLRGWHLDHCHTTGEIRGVLCVKCNWGLGSFDDSVEKMRKAIAYLTGDERHARNFFVRESEWLLRQNGVR